MQSDKDREYLSHYFKHFITSHDILHQNSRAYTPQQNKVVKCKNRHLVETIHTFLIHGEVPQHFWGYVILIACYIINQVSSSILNNKISHSILFAYAPLHPISLKVFRSTRFVHNFGLSFDKLSPKSYKCVFLGFIRLQKGYKCFSHSFKHYILSTNVTFDFLLI